MSKKWDITGTEAQQRAAAGRICRSYLPGAWKTVDPAQLQFRRISGGLSNFLFYVALPEDAPVDLDDGEPRKVLIRLYGQAHGSHPSALVTESVMFTLLSERRLGPRLHGVFDGGRIEEYIPARPLLTKEMSEPALSLKIAERMAAIHALDVPLAKDPGWLWRSMLESLKTATSTLRGHRFSEPETDIDKIVRRLQKVDIAAELEWVRRRAAAAGSPVVFCHNDLQEGNILLTDNLQSHDDDVNLYAAEPAADKDAPDAAPDAAEPKLVIIDYEYCAYNHRAFDVANHFMEWAYDYTNPEPPYYYEHRDHAATRDQKALFAREYLRCARRAEPAQDEVDKLLAEVEVFALASHLFWTLWSLVNATTSQIPFGYWEYALTRLEAYARQKQELLKNGVTPQPTNGVAPKTSNGVTEKTSKAVTENTSDEVTQKTSNGVTQKTSKGVTLKTSNGVTEKTSNGVTHKRKIAEVDI